MAVTARDLERRLAALGGGGKVRFMAQAYEGEVGEVQVIPPTAYAPAELRERAQRYAESLARGHEDEWVVLLFSPADLP